MLRLFLLRHGKAANPEAYDKDFDRPLNKKGIVQINQVGYRLLQDKWSFDQIISSSAQRTVQTTDIANYYLNVENVSFHEDLYLASRDSILQAIQDKASEKSVLYVGHNFGISDLATYLANDTYSMSTGMVIGFEFDLDSWVMVTQGTGVVIEEHAPKIHLP